jgi:hypothetical protein
VHRTRCITTPKRPQHIRKCSSEKQLHSRADLQSHRAALDRIASQLGIKKQEDWHWVTITQFKANGGTGLLKQHEDSLYKTLKSVYPEFQWEAIWTKQKRQRDAFDWIAEQLKIQIQDDWYRTSAHEVKKLGGHLVRIGDSTNLYKTLKEVYPEFEWNSLLFKFLPKVTWEYEYNFRSLFDYVAEQLGIEKQSDWYSKSEEEIENIGGHSMGKFMGKTKLLECIRRSYPEFEWNFLLFPAYSIMLTTRLKKQRELLDWVASQLGLEVQNDWYGVTTASITAILGNDTILQLYGRSLIKMLQSVYPEYLWNPLLFHFLTRDFWVVLQNQKDLFEWICVQLGIEKDEDWLSVTESDVISVGGKALLEQYGSHTRMLQSIQPNIKFHNPNIKNAIRRKLDWFAENLGIKKQDEWYSVTLRQLCKIGGSSLTNTFKGSLLEALKCGYEEFEWNPILFKNSRLRDNKRQVLDYVAEKWNIETQQDWYHFIQNKLENMNFDSHWVIKALKSSYPEFIWKKLKRSNLPQLMLAKPWHSHIDPTGLIHSMQ